MTEIKNITGNSLNDKDLISLVSNGEKNFKEDMKNYLLTKKNQVDILGEEQNKVLEKKSFFKLLIFLESLQYLEQLRQVIGLRQYGQKDPLSEFKEHTFGLLSKIKNDVIKLLLNLNIVSSDKKNNETNDDKLNNDFKSRKK